jgi:SAM-dependent methyltransferase
MFYLQDSLQSGKPEGLKVFGSFKTIYEGLSQLPQNVLNSWLAFDHFYSNIAFENTIEIILSKNPKVIFDVGCNNGQFESAIFKKGYLGKIVLLDLKPQLDAARENLKSENLDNSIAFYPIDILKADEPFPQDPAPDIILMSQFLDCFSQEQIISILEKARASMHKNTSCCILEPFWDAQKFDSAKLSLSHTSLYFTAMANGCSKMYTSSQMIEIIKKSHLQISKIHNNIGDFQYSLIECGAE